MPHSNDWQLSTWLTKTNHHWQPWSELLPRAGWPSQPSDNLCQCFPALRLIILYKANPETRKSIIKFVANYFLFIAKQVKEDATQAVSIPKEVLRINQDPEAEAPHTGLLRDFSWNWEQEPIKKIPRTELFIEKGHFFSILPSPIQYQWARNDTAGRNQVSEKKHSEQYIPEVAGMCK